MTPRPQADQTVMDVECCGCGKHMGTKDGEGQTGVTSSICQKCALDILPPHLHAEYLQRTELRVSMGRV